MANWLKRGKDVAARAEADRQVRTTVEGILADIAPTILDLAQLEIPSEMTGTTLISKEGK